MKYMASAGEYDVEKPGRVIVRAARLSQGLARAALAALLATIAATVVRLLGPLVVRGGVDEGIAESDKRVILIAGAIYVGLLVLQYGVTLISQWLVAYVGERYLMQLRSVTFRRMLGLDMGFFSRSKSGVLVSRMTADIESLQEFASDGAVMALGNLLTVLGVSIALVIVDWQMAVAVFAVVSVLLLVTRVFQRQARRAYDMVRERIGQVLGTLQEGITGVRVVQAFTQESEQARHFGRVNEKHFEANMAAARAISWYFPLVAFLRVVAISSALAIGTRRVIDGTMTVGTLVAFLLYLDWFFQPIINLSNVYNLLQSALAALAKLFGLIDEQPARSSSARAPSTCRIRSRDGWGSTTSTSPTRRACRSSSMSTSMSSRESGSPSSARPGRGSRRSQSSRCGSTTREMVSCRSTTSTCVTAPRRPGWRPSHSSRRTAFSSPEPSATTSSTHARGRRTTRCGASYGRWASTNGSDRCPTASTPRRASAVADSPRVNVSSWPSPGRSSPIPP